MGGKDLGKAAKAFSKEAAKGIKIAGKGLNAMRAVAVKLDGLTGGKLSAALIKLVCPAFGQLIDTGIAAALKFVGWPGKAPACLIKAIVKGCAAAVKAGFKKYMRRRMSTAY